MRPSPFGDAAAETIASPSEDSSGVSVTVAGRAAVAAPNATVPPVKPVVPSAENAMAWVVDVPSSPMPSRSANVVAGELGVAALAFRVAGARVGGDAEVDGRADLARAERRAGGAPARRPTGSRGRRGANVNPRRWSHSARRGRQVAPAAVERRRHGRPGRGRRGRRRAWASADGVGVGVGDGVAVADGVAVGDGDGVGDGVAWRSPPGRPRRRPRDARSRRRAPSRRRA